jgi:hypothetical protein
MVKKLRKQQVPIEKTPNIDLLLLTDRLQPLILQ